MKRIFVILALTISLIAPLAAQPTKSLPFAQGAAALKAGKKIRYIGPGGPTNFDAFHDSAGIVQIDTYSPSGAVRVVGNISVAQLRALSG